MYMDNMDNLDFSKQKTALETVTEKCYIHAKVQDRPRTLLLQKYSGPGSSSTLKWKRNTIQGIPEMPHSSSDALDLFRIPSYPLTFPKLPTISCTRDLIGAI